ncbi:MAG: glycosyltransferase family 87 protein [Anaerolineae bacterium]|nr:glycosyltransferase family 87 protein [Anaerolineae bacterium]
MIRWITRSRLIRAVEGLTVLGLVAAVAPWMAARFTSPEFLHLDDFVEFWAASRLNLQGDNPYDLVALVRMERETGRPMAEALPFWNPPWTLAVLMAVAALPYPAARTVWFALQMLALGWSVEHLGRMGAGRSPRRWLAWAIGFTFDPALEALRVGQLSPLLLAGIVGTMRFLQRRPGLAGWLSSLMLLKPHLTLLPVIALMIWALRRRSWRFLLGWIGGIGGMAVIAAVPNPAVWGQFAAFWITRPPWEWATATIGAVLRWLFGPEWFALQFAPTLVGLIGLLGYLHRRPDFQPTPSALGALTLASLALAPYGWTHDLALALAAVIPALLSLSRRSPRAQWGLAALYGLLHGVLLFLAGDQIWHFWLGPALWLWLWAFQRWEAIRSVPSPSHLDPEARG